MSFSSSDLPIMYQTGTRDRRVAPFVTRSGGAFDKASSPSYLVVFDRAGHCAWSNFNKNQSQQDLTDYYCISFLDKHVKGDPAAKPEARLAGVTQLQVR
jgi:hypothetical protein